MEAIRLESLEIREAEYKAVMNVIVAPTILTFMFMNILMGLIYVLMIGVIYVSNKDVKVENKNAFFTLLGFVAMVFGAILVIAII